MKKFVQCQQSNGRTQLNPVTSYLQYCLQTNVQYLCDKQLLSSLNWSSKLYLAHASHLDSLSPKTTTKESLNSIEASHPGEDGFGFLKFFVYLDCQILSHVGQMIIIIFFPAGIYLTILINKLWKVKACCTHSPTPFLIPSAFLMKGWMWIFVWDNL